MPGRFWELAFTGDVLAAQKDAYGAGNAVPSGLEDDALTGDEVEFIHARDSFYMATVGSGGYPYVQHRGGPPGFLRVLDPQTIAFADLRGNRQLISTGNLASNDRVALILMDYPGRRRLKVLGSATRIDAREEPDLAAVLAQDGMEKRVERIFAIRVAAFDWNCPQQITPRYSQAEVEAVVSPLKARITDLEAKLADRGTSG